MIKQTVRRSLIPVVAALALLALPTMQARAEIKAPVIAIVDVQAIVQQSTAGKGIQKAVESHREASAKEFSGQEEKLRQGEQELARQRGVLSEEAFGKKRHDFEKQVGDFQREVQGRQKAIEQGYNEAIHTLLGSVMEAVAGLARDRGITLVLSKQQVIMSETAMDLTQEVLERVNKALPSVTVKIPARK
jgi:Skp family chaperone for outer membrane proteins